MNRLHNLPKRTMTACPHITQWAGTIKPYTSEKQPCKVMGYPVYPALFMSISAVVADPLCLRVKRRS
jgi:hypothetical protein